MVKRARKVGAGSEPYRQGVPGAASSITSTAFTSQPTHRTQTTHGDFHPVSGNEPYARHLTAELKQSIMRAELRDSWTLEKDIDPPPQPNLFDTFFPDPELVGRPFPGISEKKYRAAIRAYRSFRGWRTWPTRFKDSVPTEMREREIGEAVVKLINAIVLALGLHETRVAIDRQNFPLPTHDGGELKPDLFLWGKGTPAFPPISDKPLSTSRPKSAAPRQATTHKVPSKRKNEDGGEAFRAAVVDWPWCIMPIEIKTREGRGKDKDEAFVQLGTYVRETFVAQPNRRFVPSMILTESDVQFLLWDRAGVVISQRANYHTNGDLFCRMLISFMTWEDHDLGFDPTVFYGFDGRLHIRAMVSSAIADDTAADDLDKKWVEFVAEETLSRSYTIRGRGSTCWCARKWGDDNDPLRYVVLDSWVKDGKDAELTIFRKIKDAGVETGYQVICIDDVQFPTAIGNTAAEDIDTDNESIATSLDTETAAMGVEVESLGTNATQAYRDSVNRNRKNALFASSVELVHTRTVLQCHGVPSPLGRFESPRECLGALKDVVQMHQQMYNEAKIIHRDIVPWNVLIQRHAHDGSRGILIDYSCAASTDVGCLTPRPEKTPGSLYFMCVNTLRGRPANSYLDDLESIYWILCVMFSVTEDSKRISQQTLRTELLAVVDRSVEQAGITKRNYFYAPFSLSVPTEFGPPVEKLARELHRFFSKRLKAQDRLDEKNHKGDAENPAKANQRDKKIQKRIKKDYQKIIRYFSQALEALTPPTSPTYQADDNCISR